MSNFMSCCADCPYDVGDGFFTKNASNPENRWAGTKWKQIKDMFILAAGDTYKLDATGGEATHKLTTDEMPNHGHSMYSTYEGTYHGTSVHVFDHLSGAFSASNTYSDINNIIKPYGGDQPHNNMPPYIVRYYWERIA